MSKIFAAIIAAIMKLFSPEPALQENIPLPPQPTIVQTDEYTRIVEPTHVSTPAKERNTIVPTIPPTPLPTLVQKPTQTNDKHLNNEDLSEYIVKKIEKDIAVPCLGCKRHISPFPTRTLTPTLTPRITHEPKPVVSYYPTPFPTRVIPTIWPTIIELPIEPTPCPPFPPHLDKLPEGTQINPIYTEPIYCLD